MGKFGRKVGVVKFIMKKMLIVALLLCTLCLSCDTGVSNANYILADAFQTEEYLPEYDMQYQFMGYRTLCEANGVYYFANPNMSQPYIMYYDTQSKIGGKLCGKAECSHNSEMCNAYSLVDGSVSYYNGKLYWIGTVAFSGKSVLQCMNLDGTDRQSLYTFTDSIVRSNMLVYFHRGYMYIGGVQGSVMDGQSKLRVQISQYRLDNIDEKEAYVIFDQEYQDGAGYRYVLRGNMLYLIVNYGESNQTVKELYGFDTASRKMEKIHSYKDSYGLIWLQASEDGVYILTRKDEDASHDILIKRYDPAEDKVQDYYQQQTDEAYMFALTGDTKIIYKKSGEQLPYFQVLNGEDQVIKEGEFTTPTDQVESCSVQCLGITPNSALFDMAWRTPATDDRPPDRKYTIFMLPFELGAEIEFFVKSE